MTSWSTVVLTLGSALIGAIGALAGTLIQVRSARLERLAQERKNRRERGASAAAEVLSLLADLDAKLQQADRLRPQEATRVVADFELRWRTTQESLLAYMTLNASKDAAISAQELLSEMWKRMNEATEALLRPGPREPKPHVGPGYVGLAPYKADTHRARDKAWEFLDGIRRGDGGTE